MDKLIRYIAVQSESYLGMALASAKSIQSNTKLNVPICIDTDLIDSCVIDGININRISKTTFKGQFASRYLKSRLYSYADKTLYLDADTLAINNIDKIWDYHGLAMALAYYATVGQCQHISRIERDMTMAICGADYPQYNSGVILFGDRLSSKILSQYWSKEWDIYKKQDQLALARAIKCSDIKIHLLPQIYNQPCDRVTDDTIFVHYSGSFKNKFGL